VELNGALKIVKKIIRKSIEVKVERDTKKYEVIKDYPTINGMLHKGEVVTTSDNLNETKIVRCKDTTGKIWFLKKEIIKELI
jgi:hypothetical protein